MVQRCQRLSHSAYCGLKKKKRGWWKKRDTYANNLLQKAGEATQMNDITQNQGVKGGKPKL